MAFPSSFPRFGSFLLGCFVSGCSSALPDLPPDPVLPHDYFTIASKHTSEQRPINVYLPPGYATSQRPFPVLYMPDGGIAEDFPHITNTIDSLIREGAIAPLIVVGIENTQRRRDLTGETTVDEDRKVAPVVGGSRAFREFVGRELMPEIERRYRCTGERAIVGESLAGLFVIETLFEAPGLFDRYIAMSPSLWWNDHAIARQAAARIPSLHGRERRLWFTAADETDIYRFTDQLALDLKANAPADLVWTYDPRRGEHHNTIFRATKEKAFRETLWPAARGQ
jgi:uncharacterized protein